MILIPEVSVPRCRLRLLERLAAALPSIVIAGVDFHHLPHNTIANRGVVLIPTNWPDPRPSLRAQRVYFGKTFPSEDEEKLLVKCTPLKQFSPDSTFWLFDAGSLGRFAVCLCYDFMDVERLPLYRGQIQHLFVLAYNRDTTSFDHLAESLCRTLYCNVVVCNTGYFGGSAAITPWARHYRRPVYRIQGQKIATAQIIELPVDALREAQLNGQLGEKYEELKARPPGFTR
jgi:predicted amidohydrolase